jgi:dTDP-4-amino-4,6-dideoxygalactose transaminase
MVRQRFNFLNNALSKSGFLLAFFYIITFRSSKYREKAVYRIAEFAGVDKNNIFLFGAGRMAVYSLLKSLRLSNSDEVIVAGYTCVVLTNAVKFAGCQIRYVDISPSTLNLDTDLLLKSINTKTKVIIIPHNFGFAYSEIRKVKELHPGIILIEDAAHCFGSVDKYGEFCGTIADAGFFSFEYSKPLTTGLGGAMIINNPDLLPEFQTYYSRLALMSRKNTFRIFISLGAHNLLYNKKSVFLYLSMIKVLRAFNLLYTTSNKEISGELPENYPVRLRDSLACLLWPQLKSIEKINSIKNSIVSSYDEAFEGFKDLYRMEDERSVLVRYPLVFLTHIDESKIRLIHQDALLAGLNLGVWFNDVVHPAGSFRYCYLEGSCRVGESTSKRIINLPVNSNYPDMKKELEDLVFILRKHGVN